MMEVLSVRVPKELKDHMKEVDFNWSEEIRQFIEERVHAYQKEQALQTVRTLLKDLPPVSRGTARTYIRSDRDSH